MGKSMDGPTYNRPGFPERAIENPLLNLELIQTYGARLGRPGEADRGLFPFLFLLPLSIRVDNENIGVCFKRELFLTPN
jgi:hypothetical protein